MSHFRRCKEESWGLWPEPVCIVRKGRGVSFGGLIVLCAMVSLLGSGQFRQELSYVEPCHLPSSSVSVIAQPDGDGWIIPPLPPFSPFSGFRRSHKSGR